MKRKIEKFLAQKQGKILGPDENLPTTEDGQFDFMGDLEGVLKVFMLDSCPYPCNHFNLITCPFSLSLGHHFRSLLCRRSELELLKDRENLNQKNRRTKNLKVIEKKST